MLEFCTCSRTLPQCTEQPRRGWTLTEPDVTLTDYGLTVLCSWFAWDLSRQRTHSSQYRTLWTLFFGSLAVASLTGGTVHGFFLDRYMLGYRILWPTTLIAIGVTAANAWVLTGFCISKSVNRVQKWALFAAVVFLIYSIVVLFYSQRFIVVILNYVPAMAALLVASIREYTRTHATPFLVVAGGILVTFLAAAIQQAGIGIHPSHFNHNSTYHLVQALGLCILFTGAKGLTRIERIAQ